MSYPLRTLFFIIQAVATGADVFILSGSLIHEQVLSLTVNAPVFGNRDVTLATSSTPRASVDVIYLHVLSLIISPLFLSNIKLIKLAVKLISVGVSYCVNTEIVPHVFASIIHPVVLMAVETTFDDTVDAGTIAIIWSLSQTLFLIVALINFIPPPGALIVLDRDTIAIAARVVSWFTGENELRVFSIKVLLEISRLCIIVGAGEAHSVA